MELLPPEAQGLAGAPEVKEAQRDVYAEAKMRQLAALQAPKGKGTGKNKSDGKEDRGRNDDRGRKGGKNQDKGDGKKKDDAGGKPPWKQRWKKDNGLRREQELLKE